MTTSVKRPHESLKQRKFRIALFSVRWEDGTDFKLDPLSHPAVLADSASSDCFQYDRDQRINDYACGESMPSLCQYTCTGERKNARNSDF